MASSNRRSRKLLYWMLGVVAIVAIVLIPCVGMYFLIDYLLCGERVGEVLRPADEQFEARIVESDCGATTSFRTRVIVENLGYNRFVPGWYREEAVFEVESGLQVVAIEWTGERQLTISYSRNAEVDIEVRRNGWGDVQIEYVVVDGLP